MEGLEKPKRVRERGKRRAEKQIFCPPFSLRGGEDSLYVYVCVCACVCVFVRRSVRVRGSKNLQKDSGGLHSQQEEEGQRGECLSPLLLLSSSSLYNKEEQ